MGYFMGFFFGAIAGVAYGEYGLEFPLCYQKKQNGFGKIEVNLQVFDPLYKQLTSISNYFSSSQKKLFGSKDKPASDETPVIISITPTHMDQPKSQNL